MTTPAQHRAAVREAIVSAREVLLRARFYVCREGYGWYDTDEVSVAGGRSGHKRELTPDEWLEVDDRLERVLVEVVNARRLVREAHIAAVEREVS